MLDVSGKSKASSLSISARLTEKKEKFAEQKCVHEQQNQAFASNMMLMIVRAAINMDGSRQY